MKGQAAFVWMVLGSAPALGILLLDRLLPEWKSGESCRTGDDSPGRCVAVVLCPGALLAYKLGQRPKICHWRALQPVVCCRTATRPVEPAAECGVRVLPRTPVLLELPEWKNELVVGGKLSELPWPWMVALFIKNFGKEIFLCGGSLIGPETVLTAAHCFSGRSQKQPVGRYLVRVGSLVDSRGRAYAVLRVLLHPDYVSDRHYHDLALVTLDGRTDATPVCLPPLAPTGNRVTLLGWGDQSYGGIRDAHLREVEIEVLARSRCNDSYSRLNSSYIPQGITDRFLCAGVPGGGKDACQADSGGPLLLPYEGRWVIVGVVSFGYSCGLAEFPGVYTRISSYLEWISENV